MWAVIRVDGLRSVGYDAEVNVTIMDLPQQLGMMRKAGWNQGAPTAYRPSGQSA